MRGGGHVRRWIRRILTAQMLALALVLTAGCGARMGFTLNPQDLYCLPKLPAKYTELNDRLNAILGSGAEYAAPVSGSNIEPVQLADLDGDGREEAVAFFRSAGDEKPLKIYIFSGREDTYEPFAVLEGSGTAIYSVAYSDLDGDGRTELAVGWRVNADLLALTVYALRPEGPVELVRTDYVRYAVVDMDRNDHRELVVLRANEEGEAIADYYGWQDGGLAVKSSARISMTMAELSQQGRLAVGRLQGDVPALFITGVTEQSVAVTDILSPRNGELTNIVLSEATGVSGEIAPFCGLYPTDINNDGRTEVPVPVSANDSGTAPFRRVDWRAFTPEGEGSVAASTYHCVEDGWYLQLPESWIGRVETERSSSTGESSVTFYPLEEDGGRGDAVLRISTLTGSGREVRATRGGRFSLSRQNTSIYTAEIPETPAWDGALTAEEVRTAFSLIAKEWVPGDN